MNLWICPKKLHRNSHQHLEPKTTVVIHTCLTTPKILEAIHSKKKKSTSRSTKDHPDHVLPNHFHGMSIACPYFKLTSDLHGMRRAELSSSRALDIFGAKKIRWQRPPDPCAQSFLDINVHQTCWYTDIYWWLLYKCYETNIKQSSSHIYSCYSCLRLLGWFCCHQPKTGVSKIIFENLRFQLMLAQNGIWGWLGWVYPLVN